jgi:hypothetical protein
MRGLGLTIAALLVSAAPAEAAWQYYSCPSDNFAAQFPDVPKLENGTYTMPRHKAALSARTYTATVDNVVYKMMVADYSDRIADGASILEEALFELTEADDHGLQHGKVVGNVTTRIEPVVRGAVYGRRITLDLDKNAGRSLTTYYFHDGKLYEMSALILPANGDYGSPTPMRFVESLIFNLSRLSQDAGPDVPPIAGCGTAVKPFTYK